MDDNSGDRPTEHEDDWASADGDTPESLPSKHELQELAHSRGRICKNRRCKVCAPLRELRHEKKNRRRAETRARLHAQGEPCGKQDCSVAACVEARNVQAATPDPAVSAAARQPSDEDQTDPEVLLRRQADRHRAGLPCGFEDCPADECVDGFARERVRRHRAGRPCRSATCDSPMCVAARSSS
ncbi:MAG: hypothetical protein WA964_06785 [Ilumatobacter sp.]|uniref:hypothetical protein n=1 Tax=Ilumatobacter sp. TaxID=1967498 RepID=UPI003C7279F2